MKKEILKKRFLEGRQIKSVDTNIKSALNQTSSETFNLIELLGGTWSSTDKGWNLIALPFKDPSAPFNYRLLMNQYGEKLEFKTADINVPNRGITPDTNQYTDQLIDALDYEQTIFQVDSADFPESKLRSPNGKGIHHEPGLFLQILNHITNVDGNELQVARLGTIPHGDSVLSMGTVNIADEAPIIPGLNALPIGVSQDLNSPYLRPYKHFESNPFFGTVNPKEVKGFPGFFSSNANAILQFVKFDNVKQTTKFHFNTKFGTGGIVNIPFIVREANATEMEATFWVIELKDGQFIMQYSQTVMLDFFDRPDGNGKIKWPHVSINTLTKE